MPGGPLCCRRTGAWPATGTRASGRGGERRKRPGRCHGPRRRGGKKNKPLKAARRQRRTVMKWARRVLVVAVVLAGPLGLWATAADEKYRPLSEADVLKLIELQIEDDCIVARLEKGGGAGFK